MAKEMGNMEYKSDVFGMLMQDKRRALEVYNAINGTTYDDPEEVEMTTLDNRSFSLTMLKIPVPRFVVFYNGLEDAIRLAMRQCIEENVLKDFLQERGEEVMRVMTLDFTFERRLELQTAEAAEEGERIGRIETLCKQIRKKLLKHKSLEQIADELEETPEAIRPLYEQVQKELKQNNS